MLRYFWTPVHICSSEIFISWQIFKIEDLVEDANDMFGGIILLEFSNAFFTGSCALYGLISIPIRVSNVGMSASIIICIAKHCDFFLSGPNILAFLGGITTGFLALMVCIKKVQYAFVGQSIANSYNKIKRALDELFLGEAILDKETRQELCRSIQIHIQVQ